MDCKELLGKGIREDRMNVKNLPCPLCGCQCATNYQLTDCGDAEYKRIRIVTACVCGLQFVTNDKIHDNVEETNRTVAKHLKQWDNRMVYNDMMDIRSYAEIIRDRTQKYSKMRDKE